MQLGNNVAMWDIIAAVTTSLLDSNLLAKAAIKEYGKYFTETAKRELAKTKEEVEENGYTYSNLIRLLGIINTGESNELLKRFSKSNSKDIRLSTVAAMLGNNLPVDSKTIYTLAITDAYRHDLYDAMKQINKLKLFPAEFLTQKALGKSKLYDYATDEYAPEEISYTGERTVLYKGKQQKFFLYKVSLGEDEVYLGVAGPYSINPKDLVSTHEATGLYWDKTYDAKTIESLFNEYIKSLEEEEED
jgi:hypothetical protein